MDRAIRKNILEQIWEKIIEFDWIFFSLICILIFVGLLTIHTVDNSSSNYLFKHFLRISFSLIFLKILTISSAT